MSGLQYIHFCGGFGAEAGKSLRFWELSAIKTAQVLHPNATVMLHTQKDSWNNAPSFAKVKYYSEDDRCKWSSWTAKHGAHQSDRVRLLALLKYGGLYQDTDSFMLKNCDELANFQGIAIPDAWTGLTLINGFMYAGEDRSWLQKVYDSVDQYRGVIGWDNTSCKIYSKQLRKSKEGFDILSPSLYTCLVYYVRDEGKFFGNLTDEMRLRVDGARAVHALSTRLSYKDKVYLMNNPPPNSVYEHILNRQDQLCKQLSLE